jgi:hypothetical protein
MMALAWEEGRSSAVGVGAVNEGACQFLSASVLFE